MSAALHTGPDATVVRAQLGREPREPWRAAVRCRWGFPSVIASPALLADGTPFPTLYWLTCPWIAEGVARVESAGEVARWAARAAGEPLLAEALHGADRAVRERRRVESGGVDACAAVGIGGQRDPLGVKCLHVHVGAWLAGVEDPIGCEVVHAVGDACPDRRCSRFLEEGTA